MNTRRRVLIAVGAASLLHSTGVLPQPNRAPRHVGYIGTTPFERAGRFLTTFREELARLGHIEGKNLVIDYKASEGQLARIPRLVQELVDSKVDVLVTPNFVATRAAQRTTTTIPIVMVMSVDPVGAGFAQSLRRPGGNITGIYNLRTDLIAKRVELLTELVPGISRIAILWDPDAPAPRQRFQEYLAAAKTFGLTLQSLELKSPTPDLERVFRAARSGQAQALIVVSNPLMVTLHGRVAVLALQNGLPSIGETRGYARVGGLASYGGDWVEQQQVLARIVSSILKGAKPAELPIQQSTRFDFFVNLKTAKALGLAMQPSIMVRATRVIE